MRKPAALVAIIIYIFMLSACTSNGEKSTTGYSNQGTKAAQATSVSKNASTINNSTDINKDKGKTEEVKMPVTIYYQDKGGFVIPVTLNLPKTLSIARTIVGELTDNEKNRAKLLGLGLIPVLQQGTVLKSIKIKDGTVSLDFNSKFAEAKSETAERNTVVSLVYSLTELKTVKNVKILIEGKQYGKFANE